jgi:uridine kinase
MIYRHSLCFLLALASSRVFPSRRLVIGHSLGNGFFYSYDGLAEVSAQDLGAIKREMVAIVRQDLTVDCHMVGYRQALDRFRAANQPNTLLLIEHANRPSYRLSVCAEYVDLYHGPLVPSAGLLTAFDVVPYAPGFLLRYPPKENPGALAPFQDSPVLFGIYREYKDWGRILQVSSVGELNALITRRGVPEFVQVAEALQDKKIAGIADRIAERRVDVRLVLISGPSSSGKTTLSKKLAIQLRVVGRNPFMVSLDDYFLPRDQTPVDESGAHDFEALEAIDVPLLNDHLERLLDGEEVDTPLFDFRTGTRSPKTRRLRLPERAILILEGIHGLNDRLTPRIPPARKHRIYVSALTQLNLDDHNRISTTDNRLLRRMVRDYQFRGNTPSTTLHMWDSVLRGEDRNIFPFQNSADSAFNSALDYEIAVLKVYAEPLLQMIPPAEETYAEARRVLDFLANFGSIPAHVVPESSILREFIGGSLFRY